MPVGEGGRDPRAHRASVEARRNVHQGERPRAHASRVERPSCAITQRLRETTGHQTRRQSFSPTVAMARLVLPFREP